MCTCAYAMRFMKTRAATAEACTQRERLRSEWLVQRSTHTRSCFRERVAPALYSSSHRRYTPSASYAQRTGEGRGCGQAAWPTKCMHVEKTAAAGRDSSRAQHLQIGAGMGRAAPPDTNACNSPRCAPLRRRPLHLGTLRVFPARTHLSAAHAITNGAVEQHRDISTPRDLNTATS